MKCIDCLEDKDCLMLELLFVPQTGNDKGQVVLEPHCKECLGL